MKIAKFVFAAGLVCATAALLVVSVPAMQPLLVPPSPLIGKTLPDFTIKDAGLTDWTFAAIRKDGRAVLFFWATWCPHCRTQLKEIKAGWDKIEDAGAAIMLINIGENRKTASGYLQREGLPTAGYLDWDHAVSNSLGVHGLPTYIFVNEEGIVTAVQHHLPANVETVF